MYFVILNPEREGGWGFRIKIYIRTMKRTASLKYFCKYKYTKADSRVDSEEE